MSSVVIDAGRGPTRIWPYTAERPTREAPSDPINLCFTGQGDPLRVRQALLDLERAGPDSALPWSPWRDAMGQIQYSWADPGGWTASAVQLASGPYDGLRVHLRLFGFGGFVLGGAHIDAMVPGTAHHEVIAWDAAVEHVRRDLESAGVVASARVATGITPAPHFRATPWWVLERLDPDQARALGREPLEPLEPRWLEGRSGQEAPEAEAQVPIPSSGSLSILELAGCPEPRTSRWRDALTVPLDDVVRDPSSGQLFRAIGTVRLTQSVSLSSGGRFCSRFRIQASAGGAGGDGPPGGATERHFARLDATGSTAASVTRRHWIETAEGRRDFVTDRFRFPDPGPL